MKKILVVASTSDHLKNFHLPYIKELEKNYIVHTMAKDSGSKFATYNINFEKKFFSVNNLKIVGKIRKILKQENYDLIITNTTLASFFVRLAVRGLKNKPYVTNIVHGYLFNARTNIFYKTVLIMAEKFVSRVTNKIVVMNEEDYDIARFHKFTKGEVVKINGMGINEKRFDQSKKPKENSGNDEEMFSFVGELSTRKNQKFLVNFVTELKKYNINSKLYLIGDGKLKKQIQKHIKRKNVEDKVFLVGYNTDIQSFFTKSSYYICASKIEGLPFNILEAMYTGSVVFASDTKGNVDLIDDLENGILFKSNNMQDLISKFRLIRNNLVLQQKIRKNAKETAENYLLSKVFQKNLEVFKGNLETTNENISK